MPDEVINVNLHEGKQREEAYRKINPMMALPALIEDDGTVLFESLAILEYLDETHPNPPLLPKEPKARARVRALSQLIACDTHPLIVPRVREHLAKTYNVDEAGIIEWGQHWHNAALRALESEPVVVTRDRALLPGRPDHHCRHLSVRGRAPAPRILNATWRRTRP